ncbi:UNKNOWN [Stylonychia lemnae]|uniref:Alpha-helical coiled-coil rod protein n=1 Tax=Stylonychia lemnae TaxID=5949 RepID=A0A078AGV6_STYLE|nr:UNKNOWN [Stylonychia lemnae]|eukprot:CDW81081.1 UNKNOWN [Stylonychia lemnae]
MNKPTKKLKKDQQQQLKDMNECDQLKTQVNSLKEIISMMEKSVRETHKENFPLQDMQYQANLETLLQKWRQKVYELLVDKKRAQTPPHMTTEYQKLIQTNTILSNKNRELEYKISELNERLISADAFKVYYEEQQAELQNKNIQMSQLQLTNLKDQDQFNLAVIKLKENLSLQTDYNIQLEEEVRQLKQQLQKTKEDLREIEQLSNPYSIPKNLNKQENPTLLGGGNGIGMGNWLQSPIQSKLDSNNGSLKNLNDIPYPFSQHYLKNSNSNLNANQNESSRFGESKMQKVYSEVMSLQSKQLSGSNLEQKNSVIRTMNQGGYQQFDREMLKDEKFFSSNLQNLVGINNNTINQNFIKNYEEDDEEQSRKKLDDIERIADELLKDIDDDFLNI